MSAHITIDVCGIRVKCCDFECMQEGIEAFIYFFFFIEAFLKIFSPFSSNHWFLPNWFIPQKLPQQIKEIISPTLRL